jgi:acetoacetyl-CoA synthetase
MFPPPQFFPEVRMNFAEHLLDHPSINPFALHAVTEGAATIRSMTRQELREEVRVLADALHQHGVGRGDRVAAVISNCVESVVACLATLSLGALWSTTSPDVGADGIMQRLDQIEPKLVFLESSVQYSGKWRSLTQKYEDCLVRLRKVRNFQLAVLIIRDEPYPCQAGHDSTTYEQFIATATGRPLTFEQLPFNHPGFIVYSSGTVSS